MRWRWQTVGFKKRGGREIASIEDSIEASIQRLEDYIEKRRLAELKWTENNKNEKENNFMDVLSGKQTCFMRKRGRG